MVKAARVVVAPGKVIPRGVIVIEDGKIAAVGTDLGVPQGARVLDYGDAIISAGLVDARSETGAEGETVDNASAFTPRCASSTRSARGRAPSSAPRPRGSPRSASPPRGEM